MIDHQAVNKEVDAVARKLCLASCYWLTPDTQVVFKSGHRAFDTVDTPEGEATIVDEVVPLYTGWRDMALRFLYPSFGCPDGYEHDRGVCNKTPSGLHEFDELVPAHATMIGCKRCGGFAHKIKRDPEGKEF